MGRVEFWSFDLQYVKTSLGHFHICGDIISCQSAEAGRVTPADTRLNDKLWSTFFLDQVGNQLRITELVFQISAIFIIALVGKRGQKPS